MADLLHTDTTMLSEMRGLLQYLTSTEQDRFIAGMRNETLTSQELQTLRRTAEDRRVRQENEPAIRLLEAWLREDDPEIIRDQQETLAMLEQALRKDY